MRQAGEPDGLGIERRRTILDSTTPQMGEHPGISPDCRDTTSIDGR